MTTTHHRDDTVAHDINATLEERGKRYSHSVERVLITPEMAGALLLKNHRNRRISQMAVRAYSQDMAHGRWDEGTHQAIALDKNGQILDGQQRLAAIVESGVSVWMWMHTGLEPESIHFMDKGRKRSVADSVHIDGGAHGETVAAGIRNYLFYKCVPNVVWTGHRSPTHADVFDYYQSNLERCNWSARLAVQTQKQYKLLVRSQIAGFLLIAVATGLYEDEHLERFCDRLGSGLELPESSPIAAYRHRLVMLATTSRIKDRQQLAIANLIKLFNFEQAGTPLKLFKNASFPPMPELK